MTRRGRRRLLILATVVVLGVAGIFALRFVRSARVEQLAVDNRTQAMALYEAEEWDEALGALSRAVGDYRNDPEILLAFAETRRRIPVARGRHLAEAFTYYQRVANVGRVEVGQDGEVAADAVTATPAQLEAARIGLVELGPALGRWTELATAAQDMLEATPPPSADRERQLLQALLQASVQQADQPILDRYVTQDSVALASAREEATALLDAVDADIAATGSRRTLQREGGGLLRSLVLAVALEQLDPHGVGSRFGLIAALGAMGAEPADLLPAVRRWETAWRNENEAPDPRYAAIESRLLLGAGRLAPAALRLAEVDVSQPIRDRRAMEELIDSLDRMATITLEQASDRVFRAEISEVGSPGALSQQLLERAEVLIDLTREVVGEDAAWPHELAVQWRFRTTRETEAAELLAEATERGYTAQSPVLTRWSAILPLVAGDAEAAATAIVQLRRLGRELEDASARDLTGAWGQALDRYLRYAPGVAPEVLATLNTFGRNAAEEEEADRLAALGTDAAEPAAGDDEEEVDAPAEAGGSQGGPVLDAFEGVLRAARAPSLGERTTADAPVALYLAARHTLSTGDSARALTRFRAARRAWPAWPRAASEYINALVQNGQAGQAAEELLRDTAWWQRGGFFPARQIAETMVSLGPNGRGLSLTVPGLPEAVGRVEMVERAFNVRGTYADEGGSGTWDPQGLRLLIQATSLDEGPEALERLAEDAMAAADVPVSSLRTLAGAIGGRAPELARTLIRRGLETDPEPAQRILLQAELAELDGDRGRAAALLANASGVSGRVSADFALRAALYRLVDGEEGAVPEARRAIEAVEDPVRLGALLEGELLWRDPSVARAAIDRITELTGPWATPVRLAEARYAVEGPPAEGDSGDQRAARALGLIDEALREAPGDPRILAAKGELLVTEFTGQSDLREQGISLLDQAFTADPANTRLAVRLLPLLHEQQSWDRAGRVLDRVRSLRGNDPQVAVQLADFYVQQGRIREAVDFLASFEEPPAAVLLRLSGLLERIGDDRGAASIRTALSDREDLGTDQLISLAAARATRGEGPADESMADAEAWLRDRMADREPGERALAMANFHAATGRLDDALASAEAALAADPSLGDALAVMISVLVDRDGPDAARSAVEQYLPGVVRPTQALATVLPAVLTTDGLAAFPEDVQARYRPFVTATSLPARFADIRQRLANLRRQREAAQDPTIPIPPDIVGEARLIVREVPQILAGHLLLIEAHLAAGNPAAAVDAGLAAMEAFPGNVAVAEQTALIAAAVNRPTDAAFAAREWFARTDGSSVSAMNLLVGLLLDAGRSAAAVEEAAPFMLTAWTAADAFPADVPQGQAARQLLVRWMVALADSGDRRFARAADRAISEGAVPLLAVADAASRSTNRAMAAGYVAQARRELTPEAEPARRFSQAVLEQSMATRHGDAAAAARVLEILQPLLTDETFGTDARVLAAQAHAVRGERSTAIELYREALAEAPDAFLIKNNLAYLLALEGSDCETAVRLAGEALGPIEAPEVRSAILSTLAMSLACVGRMDEAVSRAEEAVQLNPDGPDLLATLAWVRLRAGEDDGARAAADRSRRLIAEAKFPAQYADATEVLARIEAEG